MYKTYKTEEEEKKNDKVKITWRFLAISTAVVGGAYLLGAAKGLEIGRGLGLKAGRIDGYAQATKDIAYMVREAREQVDA